MIDPSSYPEIVALLLKRAVSRGFVLGYDFLPNPKCITATYSDGRVYVLGATSKGQLNTSKGQLNWLTYIAPAFASSTIMTVLSNCSLYEDPYVDQVASLEEDLID